MEDTKKLRLGDRLIGPDEPPYVIAEIGANHNGDLGLCRRLIDAATSCGADAVKFQSWSKSSLMSKAEYARRNLVGNESRDAIPLEQLVERYQFTPAMHEEAARCCRERGITFLSSCFSFEEVDLLDSLGIPCFKIASMDINHLPLLEYVARKHRPVLLSTGMATLEEIDRAVSVLNQHGAGPIALLHCVSLYPAPDELVNLRNIPLLSQSFGVPVGFSDHTLGTSVSLAAVALGACVIEKHFTLDQRMEGWDHTISVEPEELRVIVCEGKRIWAALGRSVRTVSPAELAQRFVFRRRLVARRAMKQGEILRLEDLDFKRPGTGIPPDQVAHVVGRKLARDVSPDDELGWEDLR